MLHRRELIRQTGLAAGVLAAGSVLASIPQRKPRVAAIFTELRFRSHAYNILENCFEPYLFNGQLVEPGIEVVSFFADQFPSSDMARDVSRKFKIPLYGTIAEALCVGGKGLAVDAVLIVGEHGDYPMNEIEQHLYPRKEFFDQAVKVMRDADRYVPLFNDKHLSYRWDWAKEMYDTSRRHRFPLAAGSSVPLASRRPMIDIPKDAEFETALVVHGGGTEVYGYHGLEVLQSMVEGRRGGETGIAQVELVKGDALAKAADQGRWSRELLRAAMDAERSMNVRREKRPPIPGATPTAKSPDDLSNVDHAILVTYRDGLKAAVLKVGNSADRWNFACKFRGQPQPLATALFNGPWGNRCMFKALSHAFQHMFTTGREAYPIERTLLTTGAIEAAMKSQAAGKAIDTPYLDVHYEAVDWKAFRESGESWRVITADTPQPRDFAPGDAWALRQKS